MTTKATPRPWIICLGDDGKRHITDSSFFAFNILSINDIEGDVEKREANAALIVKAVNRDHLFSELVEAVETQLKSWIDSDTGTSYQIAKFRILLQKCKEVSK